MKETVAVSAITRWKTCHEQALILPVVRHNKLLQQILLEASYFNIELPQAQTWKLNTLVEHTKSSNTAFPL